MRLQVCLNGARSPAEHAGLPVTPAAIARAAQDAVTAGADGVHVHPKDANGFDSRHPSDVAAAVTAARAAGVPVGVTTGAWITASPVDGIAAWTVLPDFASVNWHEDGAEDIARALLARCIDVEAGLWTAAAVHDWLESTARDACVRALIELPDGLDPDATEALGTAWVTMARGTVPLLLHGEGTSTWPAVRLAHRLGLATRIGLEDTLHLPDGTIAPDNANLVREAVRLR